MTTRQNYNYIKDDHKEFDRVRWGARRGMLELDLILSPFVENHYMKLSKDNKYLFCALLECEDQDLFNWFLKSAITPENHKKIINLILKNRNF